MNIELYSVKGFTGSALKQKLERELIAKQLAYTVMEINDVDQFIKAELASVPAFKIEDKIIPHLGKDTVDQTIEKVMEYMLSEYASSILVPVDFSEESMHAVAYAQMVAEKLSLGLTLVHIHTSIYDPVSGGALDAQFLHGSNNRLIELVDIFNTENKEKGIDVYVSAHMEVGEPSASLIDLLDQGAYDLMVIGTKAIDNTIRRLFGTVSSAVSRNSKKPVIVVPSSSKLKFPEKIVVGFSEALLLNKSLDNILAFGIKSNVFFDFVHVTDDNEAFDALKGKLYEELVVNRTLLCGFNIRPVFDDGLSIDETLFNCAVEAGAQMIAFVTHHRSFPENLLHTSVTRKALTHPEIPVMIFHQGK